ncbi:MAG TPA: outer membrane beta-barrel protein [Longimicrobiaceae bacterium]|nr:outer membrane beta-barrel protein [Longimicrobiaceae bacterium]
MKNAYAGILAALGLLAAAPAAHAQVLLPVTAEVRLDAGIPTGDARHTLDTGVGFAGSLGLMLTPRFQVYGGYSRQQFGIKGAGGHATDDGFDLGGKAYLGSGGGVANPYVQFGALFHNGDTGLEGGVGWQYGLGGALALTPSVRYRSIEGLHYVSAGVGVEIHM